MSTLRLRTTTSIFLACALASLVFFVLLGHHSLAEWDEGIYAEVAREMLPDGAWRGSWLTPHWNYQLWLEKPPLLMWLTALLYRMFGVSEFTSRAVSASAGVATVGLMHAWVLRRFDTASAWLATFALLASFGFQHASRVGETDVLLSLWVFVALIGFMRGLSFEPGGYLLFWLGFALAFMTKGVASIVLLPAVITTLAIDRCRGLRLSREGKFESVLGVILFLAISVPWHAWMWIHFRGVFIHTYLGWQVLDRIQQPIEGHLTHPWYYLWVLLISVPLVSLAYIPALVAVWQKEHLRVLQPLAVFAITGFCIFTLARTRLPHYICPLYPPLSVLTGVWAAGHFRSPLFSGRAGKRRQYVRSLAVCALFVFFVVVTADARKKLHSSTLEDGSNAPDSRESAKLLGPAFQAGEISGEVRPLLVWRLGSFVPIASEIYYSRGSALQVSLRGQAPGSRADKYANDPVPIERAVGLQPHALLVEKPLLKQLPPELRFTAVSVGSLLELGIVRPVSTHK